MVLYKCSNDSSWRNTSNLWQKTLTLSSNSFENYRPYDLCRFCVRAEALTDNGAISKPVCTDIRLHQEPPSQAPNLTIMCTHDKCQPRTRDANARNVSITWTLPPRRNWNGLLTTIRIFYRSQPENSLQNSSPFSNNIIEVPIRNKTANGQAVLTGLSTNRTYWIEIEACNKGGCSDRGKAVKVSSLPLITLDSMPSDDTSTKESTVSKTIVAFACIGAVLVTACVIYLAYTCVKRKQSQPKIALKLCESSGYDVIMDKEKVEYDVLVVLDDARLEQRYVNIDIRKAPVICELKTSSNQRVILKN